MGGELLEIAKRFIGLGGKSPLLVLSALGGTIGAFFLLAAALSFIPVVQSVYELLLAILLSPYASWVVLVIWIMIHLAFSMEVHRSQRVLATREAIAAEEQKARLAQESELVRSAANALNGFDGRLQSALAVIDQRVDEQLQRLTDMESMRAQVEGNAILRLESILEEGSLARQYWQVYRAATAALAADDREGLGGSVHDRVQRQFREERIRHDRAVFDGPRINAWLEQVETRYVERVQRINDRLRVQKLDIAQISLATLEPAKLISPFDGQAAADQAARDSIRTKYARIEAAYAGFERVKAEAEERAGDHLGNLA